MDQERSITEILKRNFSVPPGKASSVSPLMRPDAVIGSVEMFFEDYPDRGIQEICEEEYENMKNIFEEAQNAFKL